MFFYSHQGERILMRPPCNKSQNKFITKRKYWVISTVQFATFSVVLT